MKSYQNQKKSLNYKMTKEEHLKKIQEKHLEFLKTEEQLKHIVEELKKLEMEYWAKHSEYTDKEISFMEKLDRIEKELKDLIIDSMLV